MIELIYKNNKQTFYFTGNRTEMIGSDAPGTQPLDAENSFPLCSPWLATGLETAFLSLKTDITMEISKHLTLDILYYLLSGFCWNISLLFFICFQFEIRDLDLGRFIKPARTKLLCHKMKYFLSFLFY